MRHTSVIPFKRPSSSGFTYLAYEKKTTTPQAVLYESRVAAGFPSPASDYVERPLDLNTLLIKNPPATFFVRVDTDNLSEEGIFQGDLAIVDRSIHPKSGNIVIVVMDDSALMRRFGVETRLENEAKKPGPKTTPDGLEVWGVVTHVIHKV